VRLAVALIVLLLHQGPAHAAAEPAADASDPLFGELETPGYPDPFERMNRGTFAVNRRVDRYAIDPVTRAYIKVVPDPVRDGVRRFFLNLNSPSIIANDVLQREWRDAGVTTMRTVVNTTVGIFGIMDPAASLLGVPRHHSDFGQTLALAGVGSGPYFVIPMLGPTNLRDGLGVLVDFAFRPTTYLFGSAVFAEIFPLPGAAGLGDQLIYGSIQGGGTGFIAREENAEQLRALEETSVDFYASLRSAYYQSRQASIWNRREHHKLIRERALANRLCRPPGQPFSPSGRWQAPRIRPVRSRPCNPTAAAPARSPSP
jgi:phospholipid-binding lipoprotein MlaA